MLNSYSASLKPNITKARPIQKEPNKQNKITTHVHHEQTKPTIKVEPQNKTQIVKPKTSTKNRNKTIKI